MDKEGQYNMVVPDLLVEGTRYKNAGVPGRLSQQPYHEHVRGGFRREVVVSKQIEHQVDFLDN